LNSEAEEGTEKEWFKEIEEEGITSWSKEYERLLKRTL
jgi:hypothetical protein